MATDKDPSDIELRESAGLEVTNHVDVVIDSPVEPTKPIDAAVAVAVPVPVKTYTVDDLSELINELTRDLSGATIVDVVRIVPRVAAHVQKFDISGANKRELVMAACHLIVSRSVAEDGRDIANGLVDNIVPAVIDGVIDVAKGRVDFAHVAVQLADSVTAGTVPSAAAVVAAVAVVEEVEKATRGCLLFLGKCSRK